VSSKAGRTAKPVIVQPVIDPALDQAKLEGAMVAMRDQAQDDASTVFRVGQQVGALQATRMWRNVFRAAELKMFAEMRALPVETIRNIPVEVDGSLRRAERVPEFCEMVFGRSYSKLAEEAQNLDALGDEVYDLATGLGLNRSALRAARALPPEKLEIVRTAIGNGNTKAEVLSVIEDLAEKVQQAEAATAEAKAELKAAEEVAAGKSKTIDKLQRDLKRIEKLPPDQQLAGLKKEATEVADEAEAAILGDLRQALVVLSNHGEERGLHDVFMAGLVGQVQAQLNALRKEFNLPDVSAARDQKLLAEMEQWDKP
jgi:hypothetical protein